MILSVHVQRWIQDLLKEGAQHQSMHKLLTSSTIIVETSAVVKCSCQERGTQIPLVAHKHAWKIVWPVIFWNCCQCGNLELMPSGTSKSCCQAHLPCLEMLCPGSTTVHLYTWAAKKRGGGRDTGTYARSAYDVINANGLVYTKRNWHNHGKTVVSWT